MGKIMIFIGLFTSYVFYSLVVYTRGTAPSFELKGKIATQVAEGKFLFQKHNCISCHQLYGLGGYLGPELTTAWSDPLRGELYMRAFLQAGGRTMPNFHFTAEEVDAIMQFLRQVDSSATTYKKTPG